MCEDISCKEGPYLEVTYLQLYVIMLLKVYYAIFMKTGNYLSNKYTSL